MGLKSQRAPHGPRQSKSLLVREDTLTKRITLDIFTGMLSWGDCAVQTHASPTITCTFSLTYMFVVLYVYLPFSLMVLSCPPSRDTPHPHSPTDWRFSACQVPGNSPQDEPHLLGLTGISALLAAAAIVTTTATATAVITTTSTATPTPRRLRRGCWGWRAVTWTW
jgi:hypothetical protein